jgi:hypothetical protein
MFCVYFLRAGIPVILAAELVWAIAVPKTTPTKHHPKLLAR